MKRRHRVGAAIVGAQKCGTTTLAAMLDEHPQIRLAVGKESHLFDQAVVHRDGPTDGDIEQYWPDVSEGELLLDATPSYLYLPGCLEALLRHSPGGAQQASPRPRLSRRRALQPAHSLMLA